MHVGAVSVGATPLTAGSQGPRLSGATTISLTTLGSLYVPSGSVLWYRSSNIDVDVEYTDIEIEVTPNIGVTVE